MLYAHVRLLNIVQVTADVVIVVLANLDLLPAVIIVHVIHVVCRTVRNTAQDVLVQDVLQKHIYRTMVRVISVVLQIPIVPVLLSVQ